MSDRISRPARWRAAASLLAWMLTCVPRPAGAEELEERVAHLIQLTLSYDETLMARPPVVSVGLLEVEGLEVTEYDPARLAAALEAQFVRGLGQTHKTVAVHSLPFDHDRARLKRGLCVGAYLAVVVPPALSAADRALVFDVARACKVRTVAYAAGPDRAGLCIAIDRLGGRSHPGIHLDEECLLVTGGRFGSGAYANSDVKALPEARRRELQAQAGTEPEAVTEAGPREPTGAEALPVDAAGTSGYPVDEGSGR